MLVYLRARLTYANVGPMPPALRIVLGAVGALALLPASASASYVAQDQAFANPGFINYYRLQESVCGSSPCAEENRISVAVSGPNYVVRDAAGVQAGNGCTQLNPTTASCPTSWSGEWDIDVGALDDTVALDLQQGAYAHIKAGEGDDILSGGREWDSFDGSGGFDTVDYSGSSRVTGTTGSGFGTGLTADLSTGDGSGPGTDAEGDAYYLMDRVVGSAYGDNLVGTSEPEKLAGGLGKDILRGNAGADTLLGGDANDRLFSSGDGAADLNRCGAGKRDRVSRDPAIDTARACEIRPLG